MAHFSDAQLESIKEEMQFLSNKELAKEYGCTLRRMEQLRKEWGIKNPVKHFESSSELLKTDSMDAEEKTPMEQQLKKEDLTQANANANIKADAPLCAECDKKGVMTPLLENQKFCVECGNELVW